MSFFLCLTLFLYIYIQPNGPKGDPGRDGIDGFVGVQGPPGHVFLIPVRIVFFSSDHCRNNYRANSDRIYKVERIILFSLQLNQNQGDKGPDSQAEMFRQMLAQHMVRIIIIINNFVSYWAILYNDVDIWLVRFSRG